MRAVDIDVLPPEAPEGSLGYATSGKQGPDRSVSDLRGDSVERQSSHRGALWCEWKRDQWAVNKRARLWHLHFAYSDARWLSTSCAHMGQMVTYSWVTELKRWVVECWHGNA